MNYLPSFVFVIIFGTFGPGVRSIQKIAQWDIDFSCVGIVKESEPCDQSAVSEGKPLELLQERSDTYPGSAPILAAHKSRSVALDPLKPVISPTGLVWVPDCTTIL